MSDGNLKRLIIFIPLILCLHSVQAKECFSCEGINCLRTSKVNDKATCVDSMDNCITVFDGITIIAKGCYSNLPEAYRRKCDNNADDKCHVCYTSLCNNKGAISCLQCNSKENSDCSSNVSSMAASRCSASTSPNSYCYTRKSLDHIERGCLIDSMEQVKCLDDTSCSMCLPGSEDDACNRDVENNVIESSAVQIPIYSVLISLTWFIIILF